MSALLSAIPMLLLFIVLCPCIWFAIEQTELRNANRILTPAAALLCVLAMLGSFRSADEGAIVDVVLIPWATLGWSLLFVIILWLFSRLGERICRTTQDRFRRPEHDDWVFGHRTRERGLKADEKRADSENTLR